MKALLKEFECKALYECFKEHEIDKKRAFLLTSKDLDKIVPQNLLALRVIFEQKLKSYKENLTVSEILTESPLFKVIELQYAHNKIFEPEHRKLISKVICDFLMNNDIECKPEKFEGFAKQISLMFPTEVKESYYLPMKNKLAGGVLYNKYINTLIKYPAEHSKSFDQSDVESSQEDILEKYIKYSKNWLCESANVKPVDDLNMHWDLTFDNRRNFIALAGQNLQTVLNEWPILEQHFGCKLINRDFQHMFPGKEANLFNKWQDFRQAIVPLAEKRIKEKFSLNRSREQYSLNLLKNIKNANGDSGSIAIFHMLHSLIRPVSMDSTKEISKRIEIADSRNGFYQHYVSIASLHPTIQAKIELLSQKNEILQPIICGVGPSVLKATTFYLYYGKTFKKFYNIRDAVDACFKMYRVLNLKYPEPCKLVWNFIQEFFYEINVEAYDSYSNIVNFISDLKSSFEK